MMSQQSGLLNSSMIENMMQSMGMDRPPPGMVDNVMQQMSSGNLNMSDMMAGNMNDNMFNDFS